MGFRPNLAHAHTGILLSLNHGHEDGLPGFVSNRSQHLLIVLKFDSDIGRKFLIDIIAPFGSMVYFFGRLQDTTISHSASYRERKSRS